MSSIIKALLLLVVMVCLSEAQRPETGQRCLCRRVRSSNFGSVSDIGDIQIYPASLFCDKLEIVVTLKNGLQYCLDPKRRKVTNLLVALIKKRKVSNTARPTVPSSTPSSIVDPAGM